MTLAELLRWHRRQARETEGCVRELHQDAVLLLTKVIAQRTRNSEAIKAGVARAHAAGRVGGRARIDAAVEERIRQMLAEGASVRTIMAETGVGASAVYRIKREGGMPLGRPGRKATREAK